MGIDHTKKRQMPKKRLIKIFLTNGTSILIVGWPEAVIRHMCDTYGEDGLRAVRVL